MENADPSLLPSRLQRATVAFYALAAVCLALSVLYGNYYILIEQFGIHLPATWEGRLTASQTHSLFLKNVVLLALLGGILILVHHRAFTAGLHRIYRWSKRHKHLARSGILLAALLLSAWYADVRFAHNTEYAPASLERLTSGEAITPFQYRALIPWLAGALQALHLPLLHTTSSIYFALEAAAAFAAYLAFRHFLAFFLSPRFLRGLLALAVFLPLYFVLASPYRANPIYYPWDTYSVVFFTLGVAALHQKSWTLFYPVFIIGTFNRETTCFLTIIYLLVYVGRESNRRLAMHTAAQFVLWIGVKALVGWIYAENTLASGAHGFFETHMLRNLDFLANPLSYLYFLQVVGGLWLVVALFWRHLEHRFLRRALWVTGPFFAGMFLVGLLAEIRIFSELTPLFTAAFLLILHRVARASAENFSADPSPLTLQD